MPHCTPTGTAHWQRAKLASSVPVANMETRTSESAAQPMHIIKQLLPEDGTLVNHADLAPAPSKDFAQIQFTLDEVSSDT